ncbi:MAG TPA: 3-isopropylmalate dehydrogenase [Gemmatimonadaceae bacterium]|nr:3-isopropylmalate dehydrogenase [Gemmatimonadaceae bacterium]
MHAIITILPGDGIGPEVAGEGARMLRAVASHWGHRFELRESLIGGAAIDATGNPLPDETIALCRKSDAVLLGAVGGPKWDDPNARVRPEQGLLGLRKALGVYANLRPVTVHPSMATASPVRAERLRGVDLLVVRELTGGIYFCDKRREQMDGGGERAVDVCTYTTDEIERVVRAAALFARSRRKLLTLVDKANVLETSRLWRSVTTRVMRDEFPDVQLEHLLVDACAMHLLSRPAHFDVIVTENMFGDILTDEASMLAGSMGLLPSASLGAPCDGSAARGAHDGTTRMGLYEPIHGSAPDIAGKGIANPLGAISSVAMLLRYSLGLHEEADAVEVAVAAVLDDGCVTADIAAGARSYTTSEVGRAVAERMENRAEARRVRA